uniref:Uncharacterized protein n=1 Tax=Steinernema glaseri TaxID=37863 RepID=A0A1I7Y6B4_9BILA
MEGRRRDKSLFGRYFDEAANPGIHSVADDYLKWIKSPISYLGGAQGDRNGDEATSTTQLINQASSVDRMAARFSALVEWPKAEHILCDKTPGGLTCALRDYINFLSSNHRETVQSELMPRKRTEYSLLRTSKFPLPKAEKRFMRIKGSAVNVSKASN